MVKILKRLILVVLLLIFFRESKGQFITLPDPAFADFIANTYPSIVNATKQLDTNAAKTISGSFNCKRKNIINAFGLQYFEGISSIYLTGNNLTTIPSLDNIAGLTVLDLDSNQIEVLPDLNNLSNLTILRCRANQLEIFPSLSGLSNLTMLFIDQNKLTILPDLTGLTSLDHFICSDNFISTLPDMSTLVSLRRFLASNNNLTNVDLTTLSNVREVHLMHNQLAAFPNISGMIQITELKVNNNQISTIPDLSSFSNLAIFSVHENKLTFEDLIPLADHINFSNFEINPQKKVGSKDTIRLKQGQVFYYETQIDPSLTTNTYKWYKNNVLIGTFSSDSFRIDSILLTDNGVYKYEITNSNPSMAGIVLTSHKLQLIVVPCMDGSQLEVLITNSGCKFPVKGLIDESTIYGGVPPYTYTLINPINSKEYKFTSSLFDIPQSGIFDLIIKDNVGCLVTLTEEIKVHRHPECEPIIFPDFQGPESSYFIENSGEAQIYNTAGMVIKHIIIPGYWDGTDSNGVLVDSGLYMIIINQEVKVQISVMRKN